MTKTKTNGSDRLLSVTRRPGSLELIVGCMFSGKTTALIERVRRVPAGAAAVFKHFIDDRYLPDCVVSHNHEHLPAFVVDSAAQIPPLIQAGTRLVAVDEAHFFDAALPEVCAGLTAAGLDVVLTSLDLDSWGRPFSLIERLGPHVRLVAMHGAVCPCCGAVADHTQRLTPIIGGRMVGGPEAYEPRCGRCWTAPLEAPDEWHVTPR